MDIKLGEKPKRDSQRDAVHIAIVPAIAGEALNAGEHVGVGKGGIAFRKHECVGVVDPFRIGYISAGDTFWLCLNPGTITGMRHHWSHPAFQDETQKASDSVAESQEWIQNYCKRNCPNDNESPDFGYGKFMNNVLHERRICFNGRSCHRLNDVEDSDELFGHLSIVAGFNIDASYFKGGFQCAC